MTYLAPCPFCGDATPVLRQTPCGSYLLQCAGCGAATQPGVFRYIFDAARAWNRRASPDLLELRGLLKQVVDLGASGDAGQRAVLYLKAERLLAQLEGTAT